MLKTRDSRRVPTEHDIYKFAPVFAKGTSKGVYLTYYQHRERVLTAEAETDTTPPRSMMGRQGRQPIETRMKDQASELRIISQENQLLLARIAQRMLEPSQIDNHYTWQRRSARVVLWREEMLKNTYRNLCLLKRISETSSLYRRDKFLNDWVKQQRVMADKSLYCHDWRKPEFTPAGLCPNFRPRARTAPPPPIGRCGCPEVSVTKKRVKKAPAATDVHKTDSASSTSVSPTDQGSSLSQCHAGSTTFP